MRNIVALVRVGDTEAFDAMVIEYMPALVRFASGIIGAAEAEDVVQDVFTGIWARRESWHVEGALKTYLFAAVHNRAMNVLERQRVRAKHDFDEEQAESHPDADLIGRDTGITLTNLVRGLPARRRLAVHLRFVESLSYPEIGNVMGISAGAAEQLVLRTLRALKGALEKKI